MNDELTQKARQFAYSKVADPAGIANIVCFENAPLMMSRRVLCQAPDPLSYAPFIYAAVVAGMWFPL